MSNSPLVTIGVASYNNAKYIIETLESIKLQTYKNTELIILDDCSGDDSVRTIQHWLEVNNLSASFIKHEENVGITKVCNVILQHSSGKYLTIIGSDDVMESKRIETQVAFLEKNSGYVLCFTDLKMIDENSKTINDSYFKLISLNPVEIESFLALSRKEQLEYVIRNNFLTAPSFLFKTKVLLDMKGWDEDLYLEDWDMNLRLIDKGYKIGFLNETLVQYRVLSSSIARKPNPGYYSSILKLMFKYRGVSAKIDKAINEKLEKYHLLIYQYRGKDAARWLLEMFKVNRSFKSS